MSFDSRTCDGKHSSCTYSQKPTVVADYSGRGQVLSTVDDDRHLLITLNVQFCVQRDGWLGVTAYRGPSALAEVVIKQTATWDNLDMIFRLYTSLRLHCLNISS